MRSDGTAFQDGFKMRKSELAVPSDTTGWFRHQL
jgi:hypothetical protein